MSVVPSLSHLAKRLESIHDLNAELKRIKESAKGKGVVIDPKKAEKEILDLAEVDPKVLEPRLIDAKRALDELRAQLDLPSSARSTSTGLAHRVARFGSSAQYQGKLSSATFRLYAQIINQADHTVFLRTSIGPATDLFLPDVTKAKISIVPLGEDLASAIRTINYLLDGPLKGKSDVVIFVNRENLGNGLTLENLHTVFSQRISAFRHQGKNPPSTIRIILR